jgi:predicted HTH domain antitoxin
VVVTNNADLSQEELEAKYAGMTKAELAELLDARGIAHGANETKAELIAHLTDGK